MPSLFIRNSRFDNLPDDQIEVINQTVDSYNNQSNGVKTAAICLTVSMIGLSYSTKSSVSIISALALAAIGLTRAIYCCWQKRLKAKKIEQLIQQLDLRINNSAHFTIKEKNQGDSDFSREEWMSITLNLPYLEDKEFKYDYDQYIEYTIIAKPKVTFFKATPIEYRTIEKSNLKEIKAKLAGWRNLLKAVIRLKKTNKYVISDFALNLLAKLSSTKYHVFNIETFPENLNILDKDQSQQIEKSFKVNDIADENKPSKRYLEVTYYKKNYSMERLAVRGFKKHFNLPKNL